MIADKLSNKKRNLVVTELFIRRGKLNISFFLNMQSYSKVSTNIAINKSIFQNSKEKRT